MTGLFPLPRLWLALSLGIALAAVAVSAPTQKSKPEPPTKEDSETPTAAVDLTKAESDPKLAAQDADNREVSRKNLSHIGLGVHKYHDAHHRLPDDIVAKDGKALLSWRVAILPYLDQDKLYKEFKLDEPWDSKHNKKLLEKMPDVFRSPRVKLKSKGYTVYQTFTGPNAVFGREMPQMRIFEVTDGTSNTLMAVEAGTAAPWTKPGGIPFDRKKPAPDLGKPYGNRPLAVLMEGSVRVLDLKKILPETLKNAIDPQDGNEMGKDWKE